MKTVDERKVILEKDIFRHVSHGWRLQTRTDTTCQLVKENRLNGCLVIILFMLFIIPAVIYLANFKKTASLYIEIDQDGEAKYITDGLSSFDKTELKWD